MAETTAVTTAAKAEEKKIISKTVDLRPKNTGKKQSSVILKAKKQSSLDAEKIKKMNEELAAKKMAAEKAAKDKELQKQAQHEQEVKKLTETLPEDLDVGHKYKLSIDLKDMLAAGCHLGHKSAKTNPKFRDYIYTSKDGIEIIDLIKTREMLDRACNYIYGLVRSGRKVAFVGTKRQAREIMARVSKEVGVPSITDRWLGGTISNWEQISKNIKKLSYLKDGIEKGKFKDSTKKEVLMMSKDVTRLEKMVGGMADLEKLFDAIIVVDVGWEKTALKEAKGRKLHTIGLADTDSDPTKVDFLIPANDDSLKSITLIIEEIGKAIKEARK